MLHNGLKTAMVSGAADYSGADLQVGRRPPGRRPAPIRNSIGLRLCCSAWLVIAAAFPCCATASDPEDELKAAVVLSFLRYAEWDRPPSANAPIVLGVFGRSALADALRRTAEGK